ncbi:MAG: hypothetical protein EOP84_05265 [Verrucomicrobiaceae bacterium]|nr:MAG: hypothetical protein EOP84_05265 [Verrucomicrobiaceae bacterium]
MLRYPTMTLAAGLTLAAMTAVPAGAQDAGALVDALVRKGILTDDEAKEIRTEMKKDFAETSAGKIKLSDSLTELKLYGDLRLRYQYDNKDVQEDPPGTGFDDDRSPSGAQRSRWRFRLRLNADFKLGKTVFGGVELQTAIASDSANQTFENGFSDYPIFISKAYLGWKPTDWLTVTGGKVPNPFYTTDLVWDPDINPTGLTEHIAFHKLFSTDEKEGDSKGGYSKDGKTVAPAPYERPWELTLIAGQFIFDDNLEGGGRDPGETDNDRTTDSYLFQTQLVGSYKFSKDVKLTVAPGWMVYNAASAIDLENENRFEDIDGVSGAQRNLNILLLPGDLTFKIAGVKTKFFWDVAYNLEGRKRVEDIYDVLERNNVRDDPDDLQESSFRDRIAWLAGVQFGENKKAGDWSLMANYRETGLGSVDPNLNDSDFAQGELNTRGFKLGLAYNLTDFAVLGVTYFQAFDLRDDLIGGQATRGNAIADSNEVQVFQVDLNVKF